MIGLDDAQRVIAACRREAEARGERIGIVVVDTRGDVKAAARCDGALFRAMQRIKLRARRFVAINQARPDTRARENKTQ